MDIHVKGRRYAVHQFVGKVVRAHGRLTPGPERPHVQFDVFLRDEATGEEHVLRLVDWDLACRLGQELHVAWLIREGQSEGAYVMIHNRDTGVRQWGHRTLALMFGVWEDARWYALAGLVGLVCGELGALALSWPVLIGLMPAVFMAGFWLHNRQGWHGIERAKGRLGRLLRDG